MARTTIAKTDDPGSYSYSGVLAVFAASDVANGNQFEMSGGETVLVWNEAAGADYIVTFTSAADTFGRTRDFSETVLRSTIRVFGPFLTPGWQQTDGFMYLSGANASLKFAILNPPA